MPVPSLGQVNLEGVHVDLYIPRKCSATNDLIEAKDHASVQINIGDIDKNGVYTNTSTTIALCGQVRERARADIELNRLCLEHKILKSIK